MFTWFAMLAACSTFDLWGEPEYVEAGDLDRIELRGKARILVPRKQTLQHLPRRGFPLDHELDLATEFVESLGLRPVPIRVDRYDQLLPMLLEGRGDLVVAGLSQTPARLEKVAFTTPLSRVTERLVQRADEPPISAVEELAGRTIVVRPSSSYFETVEALRAEVPDLVLEPADEGQNTHDLIHAVATGEADLTVADDDIIRATLRYRDDVATPLALGEPRPVSWVMRPDATGFVEAADAFLADYDIAALPGARFLGDLPALEERGVLRLLTRNSAATYFLHRGELMGFEYELWQAFADELDLRLQVIVPPTHADLVPWLVEGKGDFVAAGLTITPKREADPKTAFSAPYHEVSEVVVARAGEAALSSVEDLAGREVAARPSSSYHDTLEELQEDGVAVRIEPVPEDVETELVLQGVADGAYDLALADRHIVAIEQAHGRPLEVALEVKADQAHGVLVRDGDTALREALSAFVADAKASGLYDRLHRRYFEDQRRITETTTVRSDVDGELSPYDELVQRHAEEHGFDWRLIVAQMHQESRFDAQAVSWAGARGVMQLMPRTARELGVTDPMDPAQAIEGGVTYLGRMRDRFDEALLPTDRTWLALASYNAGHGHVVDAQRLAARKGWDDGRWFGNVERAMLLLMQPKYARKSRYGYVRGTEPVHYVQTIRDRYQAYRAAE